MDAKENESLNFQFLSHHFNFFSPPLLRSVLKQKLRMRTHLRVRKNTNQSPKHLTSLVIRISFHFLSSEAVYLVSHLTLGIFGIL